MYTILLNKLRFDQISCSGRSGTCWQYGVPEWYEVVKRLGTPDLQQNVGIAREWDSTAQIVWWHCAP